MNDIDMSEFTTAKSDQMTADDLIGNPRTITITKVTGNEASSEQPINVHYEGDGGKPFRPCKTVRRIMMNVWGKKASSYVGESMTLYCDPTVTWAGMQVGGIRISHMSKIDAPVKMALAANSKQRKMYIVQPLENAPQQQAPADIDLATVIPALEAAANEGTDALQTAWKALTKDERKAAESHLNRLKKMAAASDEPDPFAVDDDAGEEKSLSERVKDYQPDETLEAAE